MANTESMNSRFSTRDLFEGGLRVLAVLMFVVVMLVSLDWLLQSDTYQLEQMQFEGEFEHVNENQLEKIILPTVRGNYLMLDLDGIRGAVESLPWVSRAWVRRDWPRGIHVKFTEEKPVALWGKGGAVNASGLVIPIIKVNSGVKLAKLSGPKGTSRNVLDTYARFNRIIKPLGSVITSLTLSSRRTWFVSLESGIEIIVDQKNSDMKLERLVRSFSQLHGSPTHFDLRYTNGFTADWGSKNKSQSTQL